MTSDRLSQCTALVQQALHRLRAPIRKLVAALPMEARQANVLLLVQLLEEGATLQFVPPVELQETIDAIACPETRREALTREARLFAGPVVGQLPYVRILFYDHRTGATGSARFHPDGVPPAN